MRISHTVNIAVIAGAKIKNCKPKHTKCGKSKLISHF